MWTILAVGFFNSIMFPTIFSLGVAELGPLTGNASGLLNMAIVGGAVLPMIQGDDRRPVSDCTMLSCCRWSATYIYCSTR